MKNPTLTKALWLSIAVSISFLSASGQTGPNPGTGQPAGAATPKPPLSQDIQVYKGNMSGPSPAEPASPYVKKTSDVAPTSVEVPGYSGILVETLDGRVVSESSSNFTFNPASNVKVATAYAVLKTFGPDFRFATDVWTDGTVDKTTGVLHGNLYVSGKDPMFNLEHGVALAYELNRLGIRSINGDLVVTDNFSLGYNTSSPRSAQSLIALMDMSKRSPAASRSWLNHLTYAGKSGQVTGTPTVSFSGASYVQAMPSNVRLLFRHESAPMREILKVTLCYSNNFLSERLGDMIGGPYAVARSVQLGAGVAPEEFQLQTSSGLGINRVTPRAMMRLLRVLRNDLARYRMTFMDIMPVAGMDQGTLANRFDTTFATGSVVGKTGTLGNTDGGVSALAGEINTRNGRLLFVIFNQRGAVPRFRAFQNSYVSLIQSQFGGPAPMNYSAVSLDVRLAKTRVTYPDARVRMNDEE